MLAEWIPPGTGNRKSALHRIVLIFTSGLGAGYSPVASGTVGTVIAIPLFLAMASLGMTGSDGTWVLYLVVLGVIIVLGTWASTFAERHYGEKDSGKVVIDEIAGYLVTMLFVPATWPWIILGFIFFRFFDVLKPPPIDGLQKLEGGVGVMIDDLMAGVYSCVLLHLVIFAVGAVG